MENMLHEFEEVKTKSRLKNATLLLVSTFVAGFWIMLLANLLSTDSGKDVTDILIIAGGTLVIGLFVYYFAKGKAVGWFFLSLIIAFFLGSFTYSVINIDFDTIGNPGAWRSLLLLVMFFNVLATLILLLHVNTKRRLAISDIAYLFCIILFGLVSFAGYYLVS